MYHLSENIFITKVRLTVSLLTGHGHFRTHLDRARLFTEEPICSMYWQYEESIECEALVVKGKEALRCPDIESSEFPYLLNLLLQLVRFSSLDKRT